MASSSEVLPWSTWPMMVTTGGREISSPSSSLDVEDAFFHVRFRHALHGMAEFGGDEFCEVGVNDVARLHHLAFLLRYLITSTARSDIRCDSS